MHFGAEYTTSHFVNSTDGFLRLEKDATVFDDVYHIYCSAPNLADCKSEIWNLHVRYDFNQVSMSRCQHFTYSM